MVFQRCFDESFQEVSTLKSISKSFKGISQKFQGHFKEDQGSFQ